VLGGGRKLFAGTAQRLTLRTGESRLVDDRVVVTSYRRSWCPGTARGGAWVAGAAARSRAEKRTDRFREVELHDIIVTGQ